MHGSFRQEYIDTQYFSTYVRNRIKDGHLTNKLVDFVNSHSDGGSELSARSS